MRRPFVQAVVVLALAGCGGKEAATPPVTTATAPSTFTSAADRAMCSELQTKVRLVSQVVSGSVELMTQSLHPKELARRTGEAQRNILYAAGALELMRVPRALA